MTLKLLLITIVLMAIVFAGFAVKMFFKKDGQFEKKCGNIDPKTGKNLPCSCESDKDEVCENSIRS